MTNVSSRRVLSGIAGLRFIKLAISLFAVIISSYYFGTSLERDNWVLALTLITLITGAVFGPIGEVFRAKFIMLTKENGEEEAFKSALSLISTIFFSTLFIVILIEIFAKGVANIYAPGFENKNLNEIVLMIRIMTPAMLLLVLINYWTGILNCYNVFYIPEYYGLFTGVLNIAMIITLAPKIGIFSLVYSHYISNILLIVILLYVSSKRRIYLFRFVRPQFILIKPYLYFSFPFYLNYIIAHFSKGIEKALTTNLGQGNVSVLDYGRRFAEIPQTIVRSSIGTVVTPTLTKYYKKEESELFYNELSKFLRFTLLAAIPIFVILFVCSEELVHILLYRGAFEEQFVKPTSEALSWFGFGVIGVILYSTANQANVAKGRSLAVALTAMIMGFSVILLNFLFYNKVGVVFFAISSSFGLIIAGLVLLMIIPHIKNLVLLKDVLLIGLIGLVTTTTTYFIKLFLYNSFLLDTLFEKLFIVGLILIISLVLLISFLFLFGLKEKKEFISILKKSPFIKACFNVFWPSKK